MAFGKRRVKLCERVKAAFIIHNRDEVQAGAGDLNTIGGV